MKNAIEKNFICPNCGREIVKPAMLIPSSVVSTSSFRGEVEPDRTLSEFIASYGGIMPTENQLKQIVLEDDKPIPKYLEKHITGNKLITPFGSEPIHEKACPHCHNNITPLYDSDIEKTIHVILVGPPGSSKTSILKTIFKMITENVAYGKDKPDVFQIAASTSSFEYNYYSKLLFPVYPTVFTENNGLEYRQPLFYCKVNKSLLIFHDYPGERVRVGNLYVPENAVPVYLFDSEKYSNENFLSAHMQELNTAITNIHQDGRRFEREHLLYTKCDMLPKDFVDSIMIKSYEQSGFKDYSGLYAARCFALKEKILNGDIEDFPIYQNIANYCNATTVSCLAAYGVEVEENIDVDVYGNMNTVFTLTGEWNPQFIYDFLLSLTI